MTSTLTVSGSLMLTTGAVKGLEALASLSSTDTVQAIVSRTAKTTQLGKVAGLGNDDPRTFTVAHVDGALQALLESFRGQVTQLRAEATSFSNIPCVKEKTPEVPTKNCHAPVMNLTARVTY
jgi:hypothetical protein